MPENLAKQEPLVLAKNVHVIFTDLGQGYQPPPQPQVHEGALQQHTRAGVQAKTYPTRPNTDTQSL